MQSVKKNLAFKLEVKLQGHFLYQYRGTQSIPPYISKESHDNVTKEDIVNKDTKVRLGNSKKGTQVNDSSVNSKVSQSQKNFHAIKKGTN